MNTQQHEWGAILSWGSNLEQNRKQDASECGLRLSQARAKRLQVIGKLMTAASILRTFLFWQKICVSQTEMEEGMALSSKGSE